MVIATVGQDEDALEFASDELLETYPLLNALLQKQSMFGCTRDMEMAAINEAEEAMACQMRRWSEVAAVVASRMPEHAAEIEARVAAPLHAPDGVLGRELKRTHEQAFAA